MTQIRLLGFALRPVVFRPPLTVSPIIVPVGDAVKRRVLARLTYCVANAAASEVWVLSGKITVTFQW